MTRVPDEALHGLPIKQFAAICNAVITNGVQQDRDIHRHCYVWSPMELYLQFFIADKFHYNGYGLRYALNGKDWHMLCCASMFPPGNTEKGQGWYNLSASEHVEMAYARGSKGRHIFGFELWGNEDAYKRDMSIVRLLID